MTVERRPLHRLIAYPAGQCGVAAAVTAASGVPHEHFAGADGVVRWGIASRVGDPLPDRGLYQILQAHAQEYVGYACDFRIPREARHDIYGQALLSGVAG